MPLTSSPVAADEFDRLMRRFEPFEPQPLVAVAVSGGSDSLALALLAAHWAEKRGGQAIALTVDHGLRRGSRAEAARVAGWMADRGIRHHIFRWTGPKPQRGIQAAARVARYDLMGRWCRTNGVLHLLLGHQREDQAETFLLRLSRGSGPDGLAAMPAMTESRWLRLLRPLLDTPRARLRALLTAESQDWVEDPSNLDRTFARTRLREALAISPEGGNETREMARTVRRLGLARSALEGDTGRLLACAVSIYPAGFCRLDSRLVAAAPADVALRALSWTVTAIGGRGYAPRRERLERFHRAIADGGLGRTRTLGGCVIAPRRDGVLIGREPGAVAAPVVVEAGVETSWDGRFRVLLGPRGDRPRRLNLGALGREGWAALAAGCPELRDAPIPGLVRPTLPALRDARGIVAVPHLGYRRPGATATRMTLRKLWFSPENALTSAEFSVV